MLLKTIKYNLNRTANKKPQNFNIFLINETVTFHSSAVNPKKRWIKVTRAKFHRKYVTNPQSNSLSKIIPNYISKSSNSISLSLTTQKHLTKKILLNCTQTLSTTALDKIRQPTKHEFIFNLNLKTRNFDDTGAQKKLFFISKNFLIQSTCAFIR